MKPFVCGRNQYRVERRKSGHKWLYEVLWLCATAGNARYYWVRRDDIGWCSSREEAKEKIAIYELQAGVALAHGITVYA